MAVKKYKTSEDYVKKFIYFDESNQFQSECLTLLKLSGHKQAKLLGWMTHEFILKHGINLDQIDKVQFKTYLKFLELQPKGFNLTPINENISEIATSKEIRTDIADTEKSKREEKESFINEEDMDAMNNALAAWGI